MCVCERQFALTFSLNDGTSAWQNVVALSLVGDAVLYGHVMPHIHRIDLHELYFVKGVARDEGIKLFATGLCEQLHSCEPK